MFPGNGKSLFRLNTVVDAAFSQGGISVSGCLFGVRASLVMSSKVARLALFTPNFTIFVYFVYPLSSKNLLGIPVLFWLLFALQKLMTN